MSFEGAESSSNAGLVLLSKTEIRAYPFCSDQCNILWLWLVFSLRLVEIQHYLNKWISFLNYVKSQRGAARSRSRISPALKDGVSGEAMDESLRIVYTEQNEAARLAGDTQLDALKVEMDGRRADIQNQIVEIGAEHPEIADERDAAPVALEELVELHDRIGLELVEHRGA